MIIIENNNDNNQIYEEFIPTSRKLTEGITYSMRCKKVGSDNTATVQATVQQAANFCAKISFSIEDLELTGEWVVELLDTLDNVVGKTIMRIKEAATVYSEYEHEYILTDRNHQEQQPVPSINYFYIENVDNITAVVLLSNLSTNAKFKSSTDKVNWSEYTNRILINLEPGNKVYFVGDNPNGLYIDGKYTTIDNNKLFKVGGELKYLFSEDGTVSPTSNRFASKLFQQNTNLVDASELVLMDYTTSSCYEYMFNQCYKLTAAPALPATTAELNCYSSMFAQCTSLTTAPELPATTLNTYCYSSMFSGCTSLTTPPELPATTLANSCYSGMFAECTSLTTAPELPATTLVNNCYSYMFYRCTSLNNVTIYATNNTVTSYLESWLYMVSNSGTFTKKSGVSYYAGESGIPRGWTIINK